MNKQTLGYHTRLHDWYRKHCIQQDKHTPSPPQPPPSPPLPRTAHQQGATTGNGNKTTTTTARISEAIRQGHLSSDKIYSIDEWCSEVNRTLFSIKKKEASPLYRKCRFSASTKSITSAKPSDPRRVRSAEVFTRTGHWSKLPRPTVKGGELVARQGGNSDRGVNTAVSEKGNPGNRVDFCVRNSKDPKSDNEDKPFPRVNHDSLSVRNSAAASHKHHTDTILDKSVILSPRFVPNALRSNASRVRSDTTTAGQGQKAKTVTVNYIINSLVRESDENENHKVAHHSDLEYTNNLKNAEGSKHSRVFSASQKSVKTDVHSSALGNDEPKVVVNTGVKFSDQDQDAIPSFCNTCSGIYSGNAPPPTPATCGSCVHGINLGGAGVQDESTQGPSKAQIQKELAKKLVETERVYGERITSAKIELKMSENRLTDDSVHYSAERKLVRDVDSKPGFALPTTFDDLQDERNLSFQDEDRSSQSDNENEKLSSGANMSTESPFGEKPGETSLIDKDHEYKEEEDVEEDENYLTVNDDLHTSGPPRESFERRSSRRVSLCFFSKPEVSNISKSNSLLRVLSIDDCKMAMRYNPHKVLEDHEMAESPEAEMIRQAMMTGGNRFGSDLLESMEEDSQLAMRLSQNSSVTSLRSSSANNATIANKLQYKILFGPDDMNHYRNIRPQSAYLTRAFQTMIHDRTIMQRLDRPGSSDKAKNACTIARATEGPKYRIINTALKREMGNMLQAQRQKMIDRYHRQKSGVAANTSKCSSRLSESTGKSLSLDSLPFVKKGVYNEEELK